MSPPAISLPLPILDALEVRPDVASGRPAPAPASTASDGLLRDTFGRVHDNLRISVTDRCNIRCFYCMPETEVQFLPREELLTFEEIEQLVRVLVPLGIRKLRLTGGEPLVRRDLPQLVRRLAQIDGIVDLGLTTNGLLLADQAQALFEAGLRRINISLDALDESTFRQFARRDGLAKVLEGIEVAQQVGFDPIKLNAVAVKGLTESQLVSFGEFARRTGIEVRFIEFMPLDAEAQWQRQRVLLASEIIALLSEQILPLVPLAGGDRSAPATEYQFADGVGRIGLIASVSQPFCHQCNRLRLTAEGKLRNCLFSQEESDLRALLKGGADESIMVQAIRDCVLAKQEGHEINSARFVQPSRPMHSIGG